MSTGSILFGFSLLILVGLFLSRPFMMAPVREKRRRKSRRMLVGEKNTLIEQIRALDFEHETGTMPTDVYESERATLVKETAVLIQKLDAAPVVNGNSPGLDATIESTIAQMRGQQPLAAAAVSAVPKQAASPKGGFCPQCGKRIDQVDKFCSTCGHKLV